MRWRCWHPAFRPDPLDHDTFELPLMLNADAPTAQLEGWGLQVVIVPLYAAAWSEVL